MTVHTLALVSILLILVQFFAAFGAALIDNKTKTPPLITWGIGTPAMVFIIWLLLTIVF